jgi:hypothetical protein
MVLGRRLARPSAFRMDSCQRFGFDPVPFRCCHLERFAVETLQQLLFKFCRCQILGCVHLLSSLSRPIHLRREVKTEGEVIGYVRHRGPEQPWRMVGKGDQDEEHRGGPDEGEG